MSRHAMFSTASVLSHLRLRLNRCRQIAGTTAMYRVPASAARQDASPRRRGAARRRRHISHRSGDNLFDGMAVFHLQPLLACHVQPT